MPYDATFAGWKNGQWTVCVPCVLRESWANGNDWCGNGVGMGINAVGMDRSNVGLGQFLWTKGCDGANCDAHTRKIYFTTTQEVLIVIIIIKILSCSSASRCWGCSLLRRYRLRQQAKCSIDITRQEWTPFINDPMSAFDPNAPQFSQQQRLRCLTNLQGQNRSYR